MMDFEDAARRLARDQSKLRSNRRRTTLSAKAAKQAEYQKKQQAKLRKEKEKTQKNQAYRRKLLHECQRSRNEVSLGRTQLESTTPLVLKPTSIHGNGDKIALPPSVLEKLTTMMANDESGMGSPWTFRIGVPNSDYVFPASPSFQKLEAPSQENDDDSMSDDDENDHGDSRLSKLYHAELSHKYLAYTHCTVVEFTQEEGHVGIPLHIAQALLDPKNDQRRLRQEENSPAELTNIPRTRTVDPASRANEADVVAMEDSDGMDSIPPKQPELPEATETITDETPGHLAWGAFDIPDSPLEITMLRLPKGTGCTLVPTQEAIQNNFYGLKDVKLVLEQSLIRTRATLSLGDKVSTWHRGIQYILTVTKVLPESARAITCINTDIEVEFGELEKSDQLHPPIAETPATEEPKKSGYRLGSGTSNSAAKHESTPSPAPQTKANPSFEPSGELSPEPPEGQTDGVCTVLIRYSGGNGKRRFALHSATLRDLFAFAATVVQQDPSKFRLVTRFPRREFSLPSTEATRTLHQEGLREGQELVLVEQITQ